MIFEHLENIIALLCTVAGLLSCAIRYVERPRRGYRFLLAFFLAYFLNEYFWTVYGLLMGAYPDISEFAAYLGWNIGYLALLLAVLCLRSEKAKRYFHPAMLLPVLLNVPQFILYISFGGVLNNLWQVGTTTLTAVFCLQDLLACRTDRGARRTFPRFSLLVLAYLVLQYGMWTSSCFDWPGELLNPYLYCSILASLVFAFFSFGASKNYEAEETGAQTKSASEMRRRRSIASLHALYFSRSPESELL